jgi:hypothetical protein
MRSSESLSRRERWPDSGNLWVVVIALAGHGAMDFVHGRFISSPGVPSLGPALCGAYDIVAAAFMAWLLACGRTRAGAG